MKKIAKLSLVAAVAVMGLTTANAQPLEEAIKNVDVSGSVVYRYNDYNNDLAGTKNPSNTTSNNYKVALNLSSKVNEDVKFNSRFLATNAAHDGFTSLPTDASDGQANVSLVNAYFGYTGIQNTTVNVGKQGLATPWTVATQIDDNEQTGTGILALSTLGPVTLAGAYFNQTNLNQQVDADLNGVFTGAEDIGTVGAIATFGPVTADAWYLNMTDKFDSYTLGVKSDLDLSGVKLGVDARWASVTLDNNAAHALANDKTDNTIAKIALTAKAGIVNGKVAYAKTGKDGGLTGLDSDAITVLKGWNLNTLAKADADYWQGVIGVDILSNLNLSGNYGNLQYADDNVSNSDSMTEKELYAQLLYKMSKNLTTYVRYGTYTREDTTTNIEDIDGTVGRVQVAYTF